MVVVSDDEKGGDDSQAVLIIDFSLSDLSNIQTGSVRAAS